MNNIVQWRLKLSTVTKDSSVKVLNGNWFALPDSIYMTQRLSPELGTEAAALLPMKWKLGTISSLTSRTSLRKLGFMPLLSWWKTVKAIYQYILRLSWQTKEIYQFVTSCNISPKSDENFPATIMIFKFHTSTTYYVKDIFFTLSKSQHIIVVGIRYQCC